MVIRALLKLSAFPLLAGLLLVSPVSVADEAAPAAYLESEAREAWQQWLDRPHHRAFAVGEDGAWGQSWGYSSASAARKAALVYCREHADECQVIAINERVLLASHPFAPEPETATEQGDTRRWPWAQDMTDAGVRRFAMLGVLVLFVGTLLAERFPLMKTTEPLVRHHFNNPPPRINYTLVLVIFLYLMCLMPLFYRTLPEDARDPGQWLVFMAPLILPALSALYLQYRGKLGQIH